jgi:succinate-acetate transporter protein
MTHQEDITSATAVPTQRTDLHQAVAELQQQVGELQHAAHVPETVGPAPTGVLIGAGSDPLMLGLPAFVVGWTCVGLALVGVVPTAAIGGIVPILLFGTAVFQFISAVWAFMLGQSLVAAIFGLFSGIAFALSILLLGLNHNWFAIPVSDVSGVEALFTISWAVVFLFLTWIMLDLPAVYVGIMVFVLVALSLLSAAFLTANTNLLIAGGAAVLAFTALGAYAWLNVAAEAGGRTGFPPLGPALGPALRK